MQKVLYACLLLLSAASLQAQSILSTYDSLAVVKPKSGKDLYQMNHAIKQVEVICEKPEAVSLIPRKSGLFESTLTLLTGIGTSSSTESSWLLPGKISCEDKSGSWDVLLYTEGEYIKNRERTRSDDGSVSVDTQKGVVVHWHKGAYGIIRQHSDTLAVFYASQDPITDSSYLKWIPNLRTHGYTIASKLRKYDPYANNSDLCIRGIFRTTPFLIITDSRSYQALLILDGEPMALFQQNPPFIILSKKDKVKPYLLYRKGLTSSESADIIKLTLLTVLLRVFQSQEILEN